MAEAIHSWHPAACCSPCSGHWAAQPDAVMRAAQGVPPLLQPCGCAGARETAGEAGGHARARSSVVGPGIRGPYRTLCLF